MSHPTYDAESKRLYLQRFIMEEHLDFFHTLRQIPDIRKWSTFPATTKERTREIIVADGDDPKKRRWIILLKPDPVKPDEKPKIIGIVSVVMDIAVGYSIHPDYWGKGYMTEALKMFMDMFWKSDDFKDFQRLGAGADVTNLASHKVLEKAGFEKEEVLIAGYERPALGGVKSDLQTFHYLRPTV